MRVALFGSPAFAIPTLHALHEAHELCLVVTQPDKPVGRGLKLKSPATAEEAKKLGLRLEQPKQLRNNEAFAEYLTSLNLDVAITAAYGKILPQTILDIPKHGFLNVHGSLLPKYRGAAPIQWALIKGEAETGISIMQTEIGLDTGPVRHVVRYAIQEEDTALSLFTKLADLGATAMSEALTLLVNNELPSEPQNEAEASHSPMLTKEDGRIRWEDSSARIYSRYQGVFAWPGSWTIFREKPLKVHALVKIEGKGKAGRILKVSPEGIDVATAEGAIRLLNVQAPNKARMPAADWANGYQVKAGDTLG